MSILDGLSGALTTATNAATAQQQGQLQGNQVAMGLMMRQQQMAKERAEMEQAMAHAALLRHQNNAPVLGEDGYAKAEGDVSGAKARAEVQPHVDQAVQTTAAEDPFKRDFAAYQSKLEQDREETLAKLRAGLTPKFTPYQAFGPDGKPIMGAFNTKTGGYGAPIAGMEGAQGVRAGESLANDFNRENQDLTKPLSAYTAAKVAFAQAKAGNPAALKPALIDFASVADPKAQLRQGVMKEVTQIDPSVAGKWELAVDRLASGKLPASAIANIEKIVDQLHQTHAAAYEQRRSEYVKNAPMADRFIPKTETLFKVPGVDTPNGAAATGKTITINGKTYQLPD